MLAVHKHRNAIGQSKHHAHVVLDDQKRAALGQAPDQRDRELGFGAAHSRGRLVKQNNIRTACNGDADLERALLGIGREARRARRAGRSG